MNTELRLKALREALYRYFEGTIGQSELKEAYDVEATEDDNDQKQAAMASLRGN